MTFRHHHQLIDARILRLVQACVRKINTDPALLARLSDSIERWSNEPVKAQWRQLLQLPWSEVRARLLADDEFGAALRQNAPLGGILTPAERYRIMKEFSEAAQWGNTR